MYYIENDFVEKLRKFYMSHREKYIYTRLMELALIAEERPLERIEQIEELNLVLELKEMGIVSFVTDR